MISHEQWLVLGLCSAETKAKNGLRAEIDFATDEAVLPMGVHGESVSKEADPALVIGAADEDGLGVGARWERLWRPGEARGSALLAVLGFEVMGSHEAVGTTAQLSPVSVVETGPDFGLPEAVEGLNLVLEAVLAGRSEDGADAQGEAEEGHGAEAIGMVMGAVKTEVVVELSVGRQAVGAPMGQEGVLGELGRDGGMEEAAAKAAVQGDGIEHLDFTDVLDDEALDDVKGVQFGRAGGEVWEMPPRRRRRAAQTAGRLDQGVALENVGDGGAARQGQAGGVLGVQGAQDGHRTVLAQSIVLAEVVAQGDNTLDHFGGEFVWRVSGAARTVDKIDAIQTPAAGALDPVLNVGEGQAKLAGELAQGDTSTG
jgi:hypothetical protein